MYWPLALEASLNCGMKLCGCVETLVNPSCLSRSLGLTGNRHAINTDESCAEALVTSSCHSVLHHLLKHRF